MLINSYRFATATTLWTPAQITTALWLDAADAGTISPSGGAVSQWSDKSGNSRHAAQGTAGKRPLFAATGLNSMPAIDCDGTDDELLLAGVTSLTSVNQSLFVVAKRDNAGGRAEISIAIGNASIGDSIAEIPRWSDNIMYTQVGYNVNRPATTSVITDLPYISSATGGSIQRSYTNGTLVGTGTTQSTTPFSVTAGYIGSGTAVSTSNRYFDGKISEIVLLPQEASTVTRQLVEGYLAHKWGLTANLPAGHPYKSTAPTV